MNNDLPDLFRRMTMLEITLKELEQQYLSYLKNVK